ncbi:MAG: hypothetical protein J1E77_03485 [Prevotella sp.]|nr:hypothetical protein [Prevotella sp.]
MTMKKLVLIKLLLLALISAQAQAVFKPTDKYKILFVNSPGILIDNKPAKVGNIFYGRQEVTWSKEKQAMQIINMETLDEYLMVKRTAQPEKKSIYKILTDQRGTYTHDGGDDGVSVYDRLENTFLDSYDLLVPIKIVFDMSSLQIDDKHYLLATYMYGDTKVSKPLKTEQDTIVIDKSLFLIDDENIDPRDITLSIDYVNDTHTVYIKDIKLNVIPEILP